MQRTSRVIVILIIIFCCLGIIHWLDGFYFKKYYFEFINALNRDNHFKVKILNYHEGWLQSQAKIRINFVSTPNQKNNFSHLKSNLNRPITLIIEEYISHGPIVYDRLQQSLKVGFASIQTDILPSVSLNPLIKMLENDSIKVDTIARLNGSWYSQIRIPKILISILNGRELFLDKLSANVSFKLYKKNIQHFKIDLSTGKMNIRTNNKSLFINSIDIQPIQYIYNAKLEQEGLWSDNASLQIPAITINTIRNTSFKFNNVSINTASSRSVDILYNINATLNIYYLHTPSQSIPVFSPMTITFSANNLNVQGFNEYLNFFKQNTHTAIENIGLEKLESLVARTVNNNSSVKIKILTNTTLGNIKLIIHALWLSSDSLPSDFREIMQQSLTTIKIRTSSVFVKNIVQLYKDGNINVNTNYLNQLKQIYQYRKFDLGNNIAIQSINVQNQLIKLFNSIPLDKLLKDLSIAWYLTQENDDYVTTIQLEHGLWTVNGKPLHAPSNNS